MLSKKCLVCGEMFSKPITCSLKNWENRSKYCSKQCMNDSKKGKPAWNKGIPCYYPKQIEILKNYKFTKEDIIKREANRRRGENHQNWKPKRTVICTCGKELQFSPWEKSRKYCSLKCRGLNKRGVNSPVYKGDKAVSKLRNQLFYWIEWKEWRKTVLDNFNWTCQECGKRNGLEVHHIKLFREIIEELAPKTFEEIRLCKILFDPKNGLPLCRPCHRKTDSYGKH